MVKHWWIEHLAGRDEGRSVMRLLTKDLRRPNDLSDLDANPDECIDEHHQATERLDDRAFPRRRLTSVARGSVPRGARSRSYAAWRTSASSPSLTVSVSLLAPLAERASRSRASSMWSVFFMPYDLAPTVCLDVRRRNRL
jgi:hypothetical protein